MHKSRRLQNKQGNVKYNIDKNVSREKSPVNAENRTEVKASLKLGYIDARLSCYLIQVRCNLHHVRCRLRDEILYYILDTVV